MIHGRKTDVPNIDNFNFDGNCFLIWKNCILLFVTQIR